MVEEYKPKHHIDKHSYNIKTQSRFDNSSDDENEEDGNSFINTKKKGKTMSRGRIAAQSGYRMTEKKLNSKSRKTNSNSYDSNKSSNSISTESTQSKLLSKRKHIISKGASKDNSKLRTNVASSNISKVKSRVGSIFGKGAAISKDTAGKTAISAGSKIHPVVAAVTITFGTIKKISGFLINSGKQNNKSKNSSNNNFGKSGLKAVIAILLLVLAIPCSFFMVFTSQQNEESTVNKYVISGEVMEYEETIDTLIKTNGIKEYKYLVLSVMQYSKLYGYFDSGDLMAVTLTVDNTFYNKYKNSPLESYKKGSLIVGTSRLAESLTLIKCSDADDMDRIKYALGVYLYGKDFSDYLEKNNLLEMKYEDKNLEDFLKEKYDYIEANNQIPVAKTFITTVINYYKAQNRKIVEIALAEATEVNEGGEKYWRWYGFDSYVQWCACFVSWCCDQAGYIESGQVCKFANCDAGIKWFKEHNQWKTDSPYEGDLIFFDWDGDGISDHVGIVKSADKKKVYTVEGNTYRSVIPRGCVKEQEYSISANTIMGYAFVGAKKK